ncbi:MAG: diguanylate cyclase [Proteobacteria bacterium]|nr:diguanylate cyclase [Pseudomonadota bacterium]
MKAKILMIEDSPTQADKASGLLRDLGYEVVWAETGELGLKLAKESNPDLILLDVVMPGMDGYTVCRWLKLNQATKNIPIIMLTVKGEVENRVTGLEIGADDYLPKPFNPRELEARIFAALRTKAEQVELGEQNRELQELLHKVEFMAITDPLTGLYNKRRFYDVLKKEFLSSKRYNHSLSCLILDLDHFKEINDKYGHLAGDATLKEVGSILAKALREVDTISRFGGEEFVVLLPFTPKKDATLVAERIRKSISETNVKYEKQEIKVTTSIGVASIEDIQGGEMDALIQYADDALYQAKHNGRNRVEVFNLGMIDSPENND